MTKPKKLTKEEMAQEHGGVQWNQPGVINRSGTCEENGGDQGNPGNCGWYARPGGHHHNCYYYYSGGSQ